MRPVSMQFPSDPAVVRRFPIHSDSSRSTSIPHHYIHLTNTSSTSTSQRSSGSSSPASMQTLAIFPLVTPFMKSEHPASTPTTPTHNNSNRATMTATTTTAAPTPLLPVRIADAPQSTASRLTAHILTRDERLCRYPSKLCDNLRSEKRGGGLHRFCAMHRERANINQRRVDHRRRMRRRGEVPSPTERPRPKSEDEREELTDEMISLELDDAPNWDPHSASDAAMYEPLGAVLSQEDLQMLIDILDDPVTVAASTDEASRMLFGEELRDATRDSTAWADRG